MRSRGISASPLGRLGDMAANERITAASLVDTHCHVDLYPDPRSIVRDADRERVYTIAVTNTPSVFSKLREIIGTSSFVRVALGLHPELAVERHRELSQFTDLLSQTRYVGEVGLDYQTTIESERATQRRVLGSIIDQCNTAGGKVVTVHSRRAAEDVVDAFGQGFRGVYILHWYSGGVRALRRAVANGAYFSINPAMARSERGRRLISEVPRDRVVTETDGPFVMVDNASAVPRDVARVVRTLSLVWQVDEPEACQIVHRNFSAVLGS
jgi:TatD DNase family protein